MQVKNNSLLIAFLKTAKRLGYSVEGFEDLADALSIEDKHSEDTLSIGYGYPICNSQIPYGEEKEKEEEEEKEKEKEIYICSSPHSFYFGVVFQYRGPHIQKPRRGSMRERGCFFECGVKVG